MAKSSLDVTKLLPRRYLDKTLESLFKNLFNRHLTKNDTTPLFGYVGDQVDLQPGEVEITETELERQINQLTPMIISEHASEERLFSWPDLLQKLVLMGVDYKSIKDWFQSQSYNFSPPIDLDKFCNFHEYFWIGNWILNDPTLPYDQLGFPDVETYITPVFEFYGNTELSQEYYVIRKAGVTAGVPQAPNPHLSTWSDWALTNLWVHKEDAIAFLNDHGGTIGFGDLVQATRPIIEYFFTLRLSTYQDADGVPADSGTLVNQIKRSINQLPLFDLYDQMGVHKGETSALFFYEEGSEYPIDPVLGRRLAVDANNDFIFGQAFVDDDQKLAFCNLWDAALSSWTLRTIWRNGPVVGPRYVKYDLTGTLINQDKFNNFKNYYWIGSTKPLDQLPEYNEAGDPEYYVIETGGTSDWSVYNYWVHVSNLKRSELFKYAQATRPIIEYNGKLEAELTSVKTKEGQVPQFKHYAYNDSLDQYDLIPATLELKLNDAYAQRSMLARIDDLPHNVRLAIINTPEILANCFVKENEYYIQGLFNGVFKRTKDGVAYGFSSRVLSYDGIGDGAIGTITVPPTGCTPEIITFTYDGWTGVFNVSGSASGVHPTVTVDTPYTVSGITLTIQSGLTPFVNGDQFTVEIKSYVYEKAALYVNLDGVYRTLEYPEQILTEQENTLIVESDPANQDGVWEVPPQILWNVQNETRAQVKQGDIYFHMISIIKAQNGFVGSETGKNNWRSLPTRNHGLGGTIKQYDGEAFLFVSTLLQEGITIPSLLEFARERYDSLFTSVRAFIEDKIPEMLTDGVFTPPTSGDAIDPQVVEDFKAYFSGTSLIVQASESPVDDHLSTVFYDTTSSINNLVATLPYLGLLSKVEPVKELDIELNIPMITHHDGHKTKLPETDEALLKKVVNKAFKRSGGQESTGVFTGSTYPARPFKGQFWFKMTTGQLFYFNVISDTKEFESFVPIGTYSYDREDDQYYKYDGASWLLDLAPDLSAIWTEVKLDLIEQNLILALEQELYDNCPPVNLRIDAVALEQNSRFEGLMKTELERFGVKYGVTDVYSSTYDPENPFTWNYSQVIALGAEEAHATWQNVYRDIYNTPRPDLEPWFTCGFASEASFLSHMVALAILPDGTTVFDPATMWVSIASFVRTQLNIFSKPDQLSVDVATGSLIAPYQFGHAESVFVVPPYAGASQIYSFGDLGPVELFWTKTSNYLYAKQKSYFRIDPLGYTTNTWGTKNRLVNTYTLDAYHGRKIKPSDLQLHGDKLADLSSIEWLTVETTGGFPSTQLKYEVKCVNRIDEVLEITGGTLTSPVFVGYDEIFTDTHLSLIVSPSARGMFWGDTYKITAETDGTFVVTFIPQEKFVSEGLNQIYSQYNRSFGEDLQLSINRSLLTNWSSKLSYRFGSLVNTDSLLIKGVNSEVVQQAYKVYLKENKFFNSSWVNGLRVQLVQRGTTERINGSLVPKEGPNGSPGEDWIWRIDNYNESRPELTWYTYDLNGAYSNFIALDGKKTQYAWKKYSTRAGTMTFAAPFLITGLQNVVNFLVGYADYLNEAGWRFNDQGNPVLDADTGRPVGYQLLTEKFVDQQFGGVEAGSAFEVNPFSRKVWYVAPRGVVSNLGAILGFEQETVCTVLDQARKKVPVKKIRVFRQDEITELVFDQPVYTLHLLTSEYEHVALFDDYSAGSLIYDSFLGQRTPYLFISGDKQREFTGRLDFGGHFLLGNEMKKNLESSIDGIVKLYDTSNEAPNRVEVEHARSLLGFSKKQYFEDRGTPDNTEFRFWQGMIKNKGTNFSISAFLNSAKYKTAKLDEFWAYKIAQYGDFRAIIKPELRVEPDDCFTEMSNFFFNEERPQTFAVETVDTTGSIIIDPADDSRWFRYADLKAHQYFEAEIITTKLMSFTSLEAVYEITDSKGRPVRADCYEIIDPHFIIGSDGYDIPPYDTAPWDSVNVERYFEHGEYVPETDPPEFSAPKFRRLNHSTIQILSGDLLGRELLVVAFGPGFRRYNPISLYNYANNTVVKDDAIFWDPARGIHHPEAIKEVDYQLDRDPASYNVMSLKNERADALRPWGDREVGKIWWNTSNFAWRPYSDEKIYSDFHDRVARWGMVSDVADLRILEWIKSSVHPDDYTSTDGSEVGLKFLLRRNRTWWQRPVAWKYSESPGLVNSVFKTYQPKKLKLAISEGRGTAILKNGSFSQHGIVEGYKIAGATYSSTSTKNNTTLQKIFGSASIVSSEQTVVGSSGFYDDGAVFVGSAYFNFDLELDPEVLTFRPDHLGQYVMSSEVEGADTYLRATHVSTGDTQRIKIVDTPVSANTKDFYSFDQLGFKLIYYTIYSHAASWPTLGVTNSAARIAAVAAALGNAGHQIYMRSSVEVFSPIEFNDGITTFTELPANADSTMTGWISWVDPVDNPIRGEIPPYNKYTPIVGDWTEVGTILPLVADDITAKASDPWVFFDGVSYSPYMSTWSDWTRRRTTVRAAYYNTTTTQTHQQFFISQFSYPDLSASALRERAAVFINEVEIRTGAWSVEVNSGDPYVLITDPGTLSKGSVVKVRLSIGKIDEETLKFDPAVEDDPLRTIQYKREVPHVVEERRDENNSAVTYTNYYFWVTNKNTPAKNKKMSVVKMQQLLAEHDDLYTIPQAFRFYNQVDGRPNRYGMLCARDLGRYVRVKDTYKLRLTNNPTLRDDDLNTDLKNVHVEWKLIRPQQAEKIPRQLWDSLTEAMMGVNDLGDAIPIAPLTLFDERNSTAVRYGFDSGQIFVDPAIARDTVKYTVLNTRVDKYVNDELITDYISYPGFDQNLIDDYLSTPESIKLFMSDLWRFANSKQVNEIFFAVLEDSAAKNLELTDVFKTSYVSLDDVRTISDTI